jgi:hypothetical protein
MDDVELPHWTRTVDWNAELTDQLDWHWRIFLRPKLEGLTDDEYFWEPVSGCWSVRSRDAVPPGQHVFGSGPFVLEWTLPDPAVPPVTTIAWRLAHIIVGCLGERNAGHFGGPPVTWDTFEYAGTAEQALAQLDSAYAVWIKGARDLGYEGLNQPSGEAEGPYADYPLAALILHINREVLHHGAEIALLRDLYRSRKADASEL